MNQRALEDCVKRPNMLPLYLVSVKNGRASRRSALCGAVSSFTEYLWLCNRAFALNLPYNFVCIVIDIPKFGRLSPAAAATGESAPIAST
jgi:hypothetical protein